MDSTSSTTSLNNGKKRRLDLKEEEEEEEEDFAAPTSALAESVDPTALSSVPPAAAAVGSSSSSPSPPGQREQTFGLGGGGGGGISALALSEAATATLGRTNDATVSASVATAAPLAMKRGLPETKTLAQSAADCLLFSDTAAAASTSSKTGEHQQQQQKIQVTQQEQQHQHQTVGGVVSGHAAAGTGTGNGLGKLKLKLPESLSESNLTLALALTSSPLNTPRSDEEAIADDAFGGTGIETAGAGGPNDAHDVNSNFVETVKLTRGITEDSRKRKMSIEEEILLGSRNNSSADSLPAVAAIAEERRAGESTTEGRISIRIRMPDSKKRKLQERKLQEKEQPESEYAKIGLEETKPKYNNSNNNNNNTEPEKDEQDQPEKYSSTKEGKEGLITTAKIKLELEETKSMSKLELEGAKSNNNNSNNNTEPRKGSTKKEERQQENKKESMLLSCFDKYHKPASWSARQNLGRNKESTSTTSPTTTKITTSASTYDTTSHPRWRSHQMAEDYISLATAITLPPTHITGPFGYSPSTTGHYPIEQVTALGHLTSPLRRPTVVEKWNPYEISTFEAALSLHGKVFHRVQKWVKSKSTKEIVEFYYVWKKTSHGRRWKGSFVREIGSEEDEDEETAGGGELDGGGGGGSAVVAGCIGVGGNEKGNAGVVGKGGLGGVRESPGGKGR